jgi:hypothetical protein
MYLFDRCITTLSYCVLLRNHLELWNQRFIQTRLRTAPMPQPHTVHPASRAAGARQLLRKSCLRIPLLAHLLFYDLRHLSGPQESLAPAAMAITPPILWEGSCFPEHCTTPPLLPCVYELRLWAVMTPQLIKCSSSALITSVTNQGAVMIPLGDHGAIG